MRYSYQTQSERRMGRADRSDSTFHPSKHSVKFDGLRRCSFAEFRDLIQDRLKSSERLPGPSVLGGPCLCRDSNRGRPARSLATSPALCSVTVQQFPSPSTHFGRHKGSDRLSFRERSVPGASGAVRAPSQHTADRCQWHCLVWGK